MWSQHSWPYRHEESMRAFHGLCERPSNRLSAGCVAMAEHSYVPYPRPSKVLKTTPDIAAPPMPMTPPSSYQIARNNRWTWWLASSWLAMA